jgi:photosystem II stability/assembly factor-like uncharacterized protein
MKKHFYSILMVTLMLLTNYQMMNAQQWVAQQSNINPNNYIQFIDAVDTNVVWGLSSDRNSQLNPVQEFTRTVNGGQTWTAGTITNAAGLGPSCIMALNADTAWVAMFDPNGGGKILRTYDGGQSWTHQATATFTAPNGFPNVVHFFDANDGFCMGDPNGGYFEIYTTNDGGNNWVRVPQANIPANQPAEYGITDVYTHFGDSTIYFGTNQGRVFKSTDRGNTWTVGSTPFTGFLGAITFRDALFGLACEADNLTTSTNLAVTTDGGSTWSLLPTQAAGFTLKQSIRFVPGTDSTFVITSPYTIFGSAFSVDNGVNWRKMDNLIHSDCEFVNATTGWSGGGELGSPIYKWTGPLTIAANDAALQSVDIRKSVGTGQQIPKATVLNNGLSTQTFNVTMQISGGYTSTKTVSNLSFNQTQQVSFDPWTPGNTGNYTITVYSQLASDSDLNNDTLTAVTTAFNELPHYGWLVRQPLSIPTFGLASSYVRIPAAPVDTGFLFAAGGADFSAIQSKNEKFDVNNGVWTNATPMSAALYQFSMHNVKNKVYTAGGYTGGFTPSAATYVYDFSTNNWSSKAPMPQPVGDYASGVYLDSLIYFIGGYSGSANVNAVQIYDPSTNTWTSGTPKPGMATAGLRGGIYNDLIVVTGGYSQAIQGTVDEAWLGQIDANNPSVITWQALPPFPGGTISRFAAGNTYRNTLPYILFTGGDPTGAGLEVMDDVWAYDLLNNQWLIGPPKPTPCSNISNFSSAIYNDSIYMVVAGGYDGANLTPANEWLNLGISPFVKLQEFNALSQSIAVNPNPSNDVIELLLPEAFKNADITLFDANGSLVKQTKSNGQIKWTWSVSDLSNGIYYLKAISNNKTATVKVAVMH